MDIQEIFQFIKVPMTIAHVLSVVLGMGAALVSDALFSFYSKDRELNDTEISTLSILSKIVFYGLILIALSGVGLFLSDIEKYTNSVKFLAKMSILSILLVNGYFLNRIVWPHLLSRNFFVADEERGVRRLAFACGAVSVVSWLAICALGVMDSIKYDYLMVMLAYAGITIFAILVALIMERIELN